MKMKLKHLVKLSDLNSVLFMM